MLLSLVLLLLLLHLLLLLQLLLLLELLLELLLLAQLGLHMRHLQLRCLYRALARPRRAVRAAGTRAVTDMVVVVARRPWQVGVHVWAMG